MPKGSGCNSWLIHPRGRQYDDRGGNAGRCEHKEFVATFYTGGSIYLVCCSLMEPDQRQRFDRDLQIQSAHPPSVEGVTRSFPQRATSADNLSKTFLINDKSPWALPRKTGVVEEVIFYRGKIPSRLSRKSQASISHGAYQPRRALLHTLTEVTESTWLSLWYRSL